jgi:hypothetical protein
MWMGLKEGDPVLVTGVKGRFLFQNARMDGDIPLWVTVTRAPEDKRSGTRTVTPDKIWISKNGRGVRPAMTGE